MKRGKKKAWFYSMPFLIIVGLMIVVPLLYTVEISFTNMSIYHWKDYHCVGLDNYKKALLAFDSGFLPAFLRTLLWTVSSMALQLIFGFFVAVGLNAKGLKLRRVYKTLLIVPWAMPAYVSILLWRMGIFNTEFGLFNQILKQIGGKTVNFLSTNGMAFISCLVVNLWLGVPYMFTMMDGAMQSIDRNIYVRNNNGELIALDNLVTTSESSMPPQLYRYDRFVAATVSAGLAKRKTISEGLAEMDRIAADVLDDNFKTTLSGSSKDFVESSSSLMFAFVLALIFIYLVLSAQFESFRDPLIIMFTVPLALIGAMVSLWYFDQTMNIFSQIGVIMLIGLVSKNGILIVEFANQRKAMGEPMLIAVKNAAVARFRPILMTSLSTVLGILPMAIATGAGAESRVAMGIAVVGGMVCATFLSLFVIPAIYSYLSTEKVNVIGEEHKE